VPSGHTAGTTAAEDDDAGAPVLTLFGSTNLNSRSAQLDLELSFFLLPASPPGRRLPRPTLRARLRDEVDALRAWAVPWRGDTRHVRLRTKALVGLVGDML
jgi:CDP-diacylglycerol--glycerol-3-phosphate 3-phosphatidyltransferase